MGYNDEWRLNRRLFHQTFRLESSLRFRPMQISRAREMILNLIDDPLHYHSHFATSVGVRLNIERLLTCPQFLVFYRDVSCI
jgi:hypothetical protein